MGLVAVRIAGLALLTAITIEQSNLSKGSSQELERNQTRTESPLKLEIGQARAELQRVVDNQVPRADQLKTMDSRVEFYNTHRTKIYETFRGKEALHRIYDKSPEVELSDEEKSTATIFHQYIPGS